MQGCLLQNVQGRMPRAGPSSTDASKLLTFSDPVSAQQGQKRSASVTKLALVIGNDNYKEDSRLEWAVADARAIRDQLSKMGFEVLFAENADQTKMKDFVRKFNNRCTNVSELVTVFYFSGHGMEESGKVFLIPIGRVEPDALEDHAYDLGALQQKLNKIANSTHVMLLDCCRANDTNATWKSARTKGPSGGMSKDCLVRSIPSRVSSADFFISYACAPGTVAMEPREGPHGYYTQALVCMHAACMHASVRAFMCACLHIRTQGKCSSNSSTHASS